MTDNRFVTAQPKMLPYWIADDQGDAFERTFGATKDSGIALYEQAVNCHYPYAFNADVAPLRDTGERLPRYGRCGRAAGGGVAYLAGSAVERSTIVISCTVAIGGDS